MTILDGNFFITLNELLLPCIEQILSQITQRYKQLGSKRRRVRKKVEKGDFLTKQISLSFRVQKRCSYLSKNGDTLF